MNRPAPYRLVVLRHGQSEWNAAGLFTGWENAHLTAHGELEAIRAGTLLAEHDVLPAFAHTSLLRRTIRTTDLALAAADRDWIPVRRSWRPTAGTTARSRAGPRPTCSAARREAVQALAPLIRRATAAVRRGQLLCAVRRPPVPGPAVRGAAPHRILADVSARLLPYWQDAIVPDLRAGGCLSHGNTLRALVKQLESIPDDLIAELDIPTGIPLVYELGPDLRPDALGGQYLDPHAARDAIEAIKNQGRAAPAAALERDRP